MKFIPLSPLRHLCVPAVTDSRHWGSPRRRRGRTGGAEKSKLRHSPILALICSALLASYLPISNSHLSRVAAAQKRDSENEMAAAKFPKLVAEYLQDLHSRRPTLAAASGIHIWDGQLEDFSAAAIAAETSAIKAFQTRLEKIPPLEL